MFTRKRKLRKLRFTKKRGGGESYTAILIEPRKSMQKALEFVVNNILENLSPNWNLIIFPGNENMGDVKTFVSSISKNNANRVSIKDLGLSTMKTKEYNDLMMSRKILDEIPTELFLVVQTDSMICGSGKDIINGFIEKKYDYVGAPWKDTRSVGNGGFSLRRKSMMLKVLEKCSRNTKDFSPHSEDGFFSGGCEGARPFKPSLEEAETFSVETIYNEKPPFGIHKAWSHMPKNSEKLEKVCTGYKSLQDLNSQKGGGTPPLKAAVMAIFKNESMVIREWIEHYKWQGMDHLFMINNDSNDDWQSIVKDYPDFVTAVDYPGKHVQLKAYNEKALPFLREKGIDVVVVVDLDEYLFGTDGKNLKEHIQEIFSKPDRPSAFTCGWTMFGSSGFKTQPASIRESFIGTWTGKAEPENGISGKTITFLKDIQDLTDIHIPDVSGRRDSCPVGLQLNHYPIMSEEYFQKVKMPRGDAFTITNENARDMEYYKRYDKNDVKDTKLADLVKAIQKGGKKSSSRTRKRKQKGGIRRRYWGDDEPKTFHFWNGYHYGDNILNLKFLYNISEILKAKRISIKYYYDPEYIKNTIELERYLHPNGVVTLHSLHYRPGDAIELWMGNPIDGVEYKMFDKYFKLFYTNILNILGLQNEGIETSLYQPSPNLEEIYQNLDDKFKDLDILIINGKSNSFKMDFDDEKFDDMCERLSKIYKVATTSPVNHNIPCTMRDSLTLQDIGAISTHVKYIIGIHTGPLAACFTEATKHNVKKWIIMANDGTTFQDINNIVVPDTYNINSVENNIN